MPPSAWPARSRSSSTGRPPRPPGLRTSDAGLLERLGKTSDELRFQNRIYLAASTTTTPRRSTSPTPSMMWTAHVLRLAHTNEAGAQIVAGSRPWDRGLADVVAKLH
ncbi:MAG: hypothetical protein R2746_10430 [Acidimicrobiales bacterium]